MFGIIGSILNSVVGGIVSPLFGWLSSREEIRYKEFAVMTESERAIYQQWLQTWSQVAAEKSSMNRWFGARVLMILFGVPPALHLGAIYITATFPLGIAVPALHGLYADLEKTIALSFFVVTPAMPLISSLADFLRKR